MIDKQQQAKSRKCDNQYQVHIKTVRKIIYEQGYVINSKAVDAVIGLESYTPTRVSLIIIHT